MSKIIQSKSNVGGMGWCAKLIGKMNSIPEVPGIRDHFPSGAVREGICRDGSWVLMEFNL